MADPDDAVPDEVAGVDPEAEEAERWSGDDTIDLLDTFDGDASGEETGDGDATDAACAAAADPARDAASSIVSRISLCPTKAGMENVDQQEANRIILQMSQGSRFFRNEQRKDAKASVRVRQLVAKARAFPPEVIRRAEHGLRPLERLLEERRDLSRVVVHVDADAFFASVEERDHPWLKDKPVGIGGMSMLSTANYHARRFGVRSAMPGYIAKRLCPDLILIKGRPQAYAEASRAIQAVLALYDPQFRAVSLDEAYLDITDYLRRLSPKAQAALPLDETFTLAERVVHEMRMKITAATRLTFYLPPNREAILAFLHPMTIRKIPGIGKVTERVLNELQIKSCGQLYEQRGLLKLLFSETSFRFFFSACLGIRAEQEGEQGATRKSISHERTFAELSKVEDLEARCRALCTALAEDVATKQLQGRCVTLKLKTVNFEVKQRSLMFADYAAGSELLEDAALKLLRREMAAADASGQPLALRLMGVRLSQLRSVVAQTPASGAIIKPVTAFFAQAGPLGQANDSGFYRCPSCDQRLKLVGNAALNRHLDLCLNQGALAALVGQDDGGGVAPKRTKGLVPLKAEAPGLLRFLRPVGPQPLTQRLPEAPSHSLAAFQQ